MRHARFFAREEFFGWLLFDTRTHQYVVPVTDSAIHAFRSVVEDRILPRAQDLPASDPRDADDVIDWLHDNRCVPASVHISNRDPKQGMLSAPLNVYFDFTSLCNLSCTMCYDEPKRAGTKRAFELSLDEIDDVFAQLRGMGVFRVDLAGGEPTLLPDVLDKYLESARSRDISVSMTTNATRLTDALSRRILRHDLKTITVSIDGYDAATNDHIRGCGAFEKAVAGVQTLIAAKRALGSRTIIAIKNTFRPTIDFNDIGRFVALGESLAIDKVKFNPMRPSGGASSDRELIDCPDAYYAALREIKRIAGTDRDVEVDGPVNPVTCFGGRVPHITDWGCIAGKELLTIDSIGNVRPCSMMNDFIVGNIRERPIRDIYHDGQLGKLRGIEKDECSACAAYMTCRGGCRIRSQAAGDFFAKDPLCPKDAGQEMTYSAKQSSPFQYLGLPHAL